MTVKNFVAKHRATGAGLAGIMLTPNFALAYARLRLYRLLRKMSVLLLLADSVLSTSA